VSARLWPQEFEVGRYPDLTSVTAGAGSFHGINANVPHYCSSSYFPLASSSWALTLASSLSA
jgi:hypothetical protein